MWPSQNKAAFPSFSVFSQIIVFDLLLFSGTDANMFFFFDVVVIALALEGREEVKVIIVDGDQRVGHVTFF